MQDQAVAQFKLEIDPGSGRRRGFQRTEIEECQRAGAAHDFTASFDSR